MGWSGWVDQGGALVASSLIKARNGKHQDLHTPVVYSLPPFCWKVCGWAQKHSCSLLQLQSFVPGPNLCCVADLQVCCCSMFGAVVVGVGTAGSVRIRDMLAPLAGSPAEKLAVRGFVSRYQELLIYLEKRSAHSEPWTCVSCCRLCWAGWLRAWLHLSFRF